MKESFLDLLVGGAWSFLVRGVICLLNCANERDLDLLVRHLLTISVVMGFGFTEIRLFLRDTS